ncbi:hypothetical protein J2X36_005007 [Methylobacterium sp. BE186]|uniref:hypothetical protein n=1 Tax=Methylobacterium sp. BE186 TaxID=2817715 RepID=UPI002866EC8D|nr:hypothetical protein [Methylobacterium sp. BE186]MDR7040225.1 hypothetical protein [Methylobacterium sp. BE186]
MSDHRSHEALADAVAAAYAEGTRPPLTPDLIKQVRTAVLSDGLAGCDPEDPTCIDRINRALDAFEVALEAVAGPRLVAFDLRTGAARMEARSEAGRPLRSFGGQ